MFSLPYLYIIRSNVPSSIYYKLLKILHVYITYRYDKTRASEDSHFDSILPTLLDMVRIVDGNAGIQAYFLCNMFNTFRNIREGNNEVRATTSVFRP